MSGSIAPPAAALTTLDGTRSTIQAESDGALVLAGRGSTSQGSTCSGIDGEPRQHARSAIRPLATAASVSEREEMSSARAPRSDRGRATRWHRRVWR